MSYSERLRSLNLFSIEGRLLRSDLIKYWKVVCCDSEGFDLSVLFQRSREERTRGHKFRLLLPRCNTDIKQRFFYVRAIRVWNASPDKVVDSVPLAAFKVNLAEYLGDILFEYS